VRNSPISLTFFLSCGALLSLQAADDSVSFEKDVMPFLDTYCYRCHDDDVQKGDVNLWLFEDKAAVLHDRKTWLKVLEQLETQEMPTKKPFPTQEEYERMIHWIESEVHNLDYRALNHPGHVTIPRLTRTEYNRTMRDLLGIPYDAGYALSEDGQGQSGFNNDRDALFMTSGQMEKYFMAAEKAVLAVLTARDEPFRKKLEAESMFMTESKTNLSTRGDAKGYALNRGQMTLYDSVSFPADGVYEFRLRSWTTSGPTAARLRINDVVRGDFFVSSPDPEVVTIQAFAEAGSQQVAFNIQRPDYRKVDELREEQLNKVTDYTVLPENASEIISTESQKHAPLWPLDPEVEGDLRKAIIMVNRDSYTVQRAYEWLRLHGANGEPSQVLRFRSYVEDRDKDLQAAKGKLAEALGLSIKEFEAQWRKVNEKQLADQAAIMAAGAHITQESLREQRRKENADQAPGSVGIDWLEVVGPIRPKEAEELVLVAEPGPKLSERAAAEKILEHFLPRAFRRPVAKQEQERYLQLYDAARKSGESYESGLKHALVGVLVSPNFLYRVELAPKNPDEDFPLNDHQLASRLSYYLWMTMPDHKLFALADAGELSKPKVLRGQVRRMLKDPRSRSMVETFLGQWLGFSILGETHVPDARAFRREYDDDLGWAMREEPVLVFKRMIAENRSLDQLLDSRETFVNKDLADHYGIPDIPEVGYHLVSLDDPNRGGLLGMGAILTTTSTPVRTSPVIRGTWVLETLLGEEIPTPPADAGTLPANAGKGNLTLREELAQHRDREDCAGCHDKIDPLGFGLENFDAIGRWRDVDEKKKPIDASGEVPGGASFNGPAELRDYLLKNRREEFLRHMTEQMLGFALGRELQLYDEPVIEDILAALEQKHYGAAELIQQVVGSYAFQHQAPSAEIPEG